MKSNGPVAQRPAMRPCCRSVREAPGQLAGAAKEGLLALSVGVGLGVRQADCESMIGDLRTHQRNVKHWSSGGVGLRWTAAGMLEAAAQFRRIIGHGDLAKLAIAIEHRRGRVF